MSSRDELEVLVYGTRVGTLVPHSQERMRFVPDPLWLDGGQRPPLGLSWLVDPSPRIGRRSLPAWFDNLLPEPGTVLRRWLCRHHELHETDSPGLLAALGTDLPGAVEVRGEPDRADPGEFPQEPEGHMRFSLAGMQLKLSMLRRGDRFVFPARDEHGSWIVKLPGEQFPELPEIEAATMTWARAFGLEVPEFQVLPIELVQGVDLKSLGEPVRAFAIKRFDRQDVGRVHQEDFAQALEFEPEHKYGDGPRGTSYDALGLLVRDACGIEEQNEFVDRLAFVVASGNDDAHLKNWTFQWGHNHKPWLSPCYDLVATISWPAFGWDTPKGPTLALGLGKTRRFAELTRHNLQRFARRASAVDGSERFLAALERTREAWLSMEDQAPGRMREALEEHWSRVPLLRQLGGLGGRR